MSVLTQTKWNNATQDYKPRHMEVVLVCVKGIYHITLYDEENNHFRLREDPSSYFDPEKQLIYWTEFVNPKELENNN
jgi:hypothetical protein